MSLEGLRVVVDCANGAAYRVVPEALWELGAEVIAIGVEPDGFNINQRLRLDRARGAVPQGARDARRHRHRARRRRRPRDHRRRARPHRRRRPAAGGDRRELAGGRPPRQARHRRDRDVESRARALSRQRSGSRWRARRSATATCSSTCASTATIVGGEQSGHIILSDYTTTGDGFVAALQVLAVVKKLGPAGVGGLPPLRPAAAGAQERALQERQAARGRQGAQRHQGRPSSGSTARAGW